MASAARALARGIDAERDLSQTAIDLAETLRPRAGDATVDAADLFLVTSPPSPDLRREAK